MQIKEVFLKNDGTINKNRVIIEFGDFGNSVITLFFSYETIVGFTFKGEKYVTVNNWSTTTGKYLNELEPDHKKRIPHEEVLQKLSNVFQFISKYTC